MSGRVEISGVVLRGEDFNFTAGPWRRIERANALRVVPILVAGVAAVVLFGMAEDPSARGMVAVFAPLILGWFAFIWQTNAHYMGEYKKAYAESPTGGAPCDFVFDEQGVKQRGLGYETAFTWSAFVDVIETPQSFRFWLSPFSAITLPMRYLNDDQRAALRRLVADARAAGAFPGARN